MNYTEKVREYTVGTLPWVPPAPAISILHCALITMITALSPTEQNSDSYTLGQSRSVSAQHDHKGSPPVSGMH